MITTNDPQAAVKVEPKKLKQITTAIIPNAVSQPEPKGTGFVRMITTHDERDVEDMSEDNMGAERDAQVISEPRTGEEKAVPAPSHKKPGRPKKGE